MSKTRYAVWPLVIAAIFLIAAVASIFVLPTIDPTLTVGGFPVEQNKEMITLGLFGFTLIFAALSFILRKTDKELVVKTSQPKTKKAKKEAPTAQMAAVASAYGYEEEAKPVGLTPEQRAMQREERKRELEAGKFRRAAEKEAAKAERAAKKAARKGRKVEMVEVDEVSDLNQYDVEETVYDTPAETTVQQPEWIEAAYTDESFEVPFADQEEPVFTPEPAEEIVEEVLIIEEEPVEEESEENMAKETVADVVISEDFEAETEEINEEAAEELAEEIVEALVEEAIIEEILEEESEAIVEEVILEELAEAEEEILEEAEEPKELTLAEKMAALFVEAQIQAEKEAEEKFATENVKLRQELEELKELLLSTNSKARRANARKHNQHKRKPRGQR